MALYDITKLRGASTVTKDSLVKLSPTTFATEGIKERDHLQAAIRDHIDLIDPRLHVVAEEFGDFDGANRRIDLLCIDKDCRLVVVELKRTSDGGHMELQALRYAAMVSTMTFSQVVTAHARYLNARGAIGSTEDTARSTLLDWLGLSDDEPPEIPRDVAIILASEDFSQEITTAVLWLNEFHAFDIRCIRLKPYRLDNRLLLDVQPVIPLPEASAYTIRVREKEIAEKQAQASNADWTKFVIVTPTGRTSPQPKRWAVLSMVKGLAAAGVRMTDIRAVLPDSKTLQVEGLLTDPDQLWAAAAEKYDKSPENRRRWHLDDPIHEDDTTWILNNNWGLGTREFLDALTKLAPPGQFAFYEEGAEPAAPTG